MIIKILGTGCAKCHKLYEAVTQAIQETGIVAQVEKITNIAEILSFEILMLPGLIINEDIKSAGRVPSVNEIKQMLLDLSKS